MLDWTNRATNSQDGAAKTSGGGRSGGSLIARALGGLIGVYLLIALVVGWYWSQEPSAFQVQQHAQNSAQQAQRQMVTGYTSVETLKQVASTSAKSTSMARSR